MRKIETTTITRFNTKGLMSFKLETELEMFDMQFNHIVKNIIMAL